MKFKLRQDQKLYAYDIVVPFKISKSKHDQQNG